MRSAGRLAALAALLSLLAPAADGANAGTSQAQLAAMPLTAASFGSVARTLPIASDSGVESNAVAASDANQNVTGAKLARIGRLTGYTLDYGALPSGPRVFDFASGVELYKSPADALAGFAFWRKDDATSPHDGLTVVASFYRVSGLGHSSYGWAGKGSLKALAPFYTASVSFVEGDLVAGVSISGTTPAGLRPLTLAAGRALHARIGAVLAGRAVSPSPKLPVTSITTAGPPPGGPNLEALALRANDLGPGTVKGQGYQRNPIFGPVSRYERTMVPAGPFAFFQEDVSYFANTTEARWVLVAFRDVFSASDVWRSFIGSTFKSFRVRPVPLSDGDQSIAFIATAKLTDDRTVNFSFIEVRNGKTLLMTIAATPAGAQLPASAVKSLANVALKRATPQTGFTA